MTQRFGALTTRDAVQRLRTVLDDVAWSAREHEDGNPWEADQLAGIAQRLEGIIDLYDEEEQA
jgi:hypothetical protein